MKTPITKKPIRHPTTRKKALLGAVTVGLAAVGTVALPVPAALAHHLPADRCDQKMAPDETWTVKHPGNQVSTSFPPDPNPPNGIFPGDVIKVTITGSIRVDEWWPWANWYGASGAPEGHVDDWPGTGWPFPEMNPFSSVARFNNNPGGWVGAPMHTSGLTPPDAPPGTIKLNNCTPAPSQAVRLIYYINDPKLSDNGGEFTIRTDVYRATKTCPPWQFYAGIYGCVPRP